MTDEQLIETIASTEEAMAAMRLTRSPAHRQTMLRFLADIVENGFSLPGLASHTPGVIRPETDEEAELASLHACLTPLQRLGMFAILHGLQQRSEGFYEGAMAERQANGGQ